jgi:hypothetical protein
VKRLLVTGRYPPVTPQCSWGSWVVFRFGLFLIDETAFPRSCSSAVVEWPLGKSAACGHIVVPRSWSSSSATTDSDQVCWLALLCHFEYSSVARFKHDDTMEVA